MKTLLLATLLLFTNSDCLIATKIPFPRSEYNNKQFNELSMKHVDTWIKTYEAIKLPYETYAKPGYLNEYEFLYAWCNNLHQFVLIAYHNNKYNYYKYNPIFIK